MTRAIALGPILFVFAAAACGSPSEAPVVAPGSAAASSGAESAVTYDALPRLRFNQLAVRLNIPLFWESDANGNGAADPAEVRSLLFYPTQVAWVEGDAFTPAFREAYDAMVAMAAAEESGEAPASEDEAEAARLRLVWLELDQGAPTLVRHDLRSIPEHEKTMVRHVLAAAQGIDALYAAQTGMAALADRVPKDSASQSLFRRNWGPKCEGPRTENEEACSAIPGAPSPLVDVYPAAMQSDDEFCKALEERSNASELLSPFTVVREVDGELRAVPYTEHYRTTMGAIAGELRAAAAAIEADASEAALRAYLAAAAESFEDNNWERADEAWAAMNARNSKWYLRVGPDEVYWDPCSHKAGFHLTFARINRDSLEWQDKLTPLQQDMEQAVADLIGSAYDAREVSFHLPDFIDIVINAGDDRGPFGATIGQSLPNWGPVANEGRGRTVAMSNLYTDPDSIGTLRNQAASLLGASTMELYSDEATSSLMGTILHEAMHNLGPAHEYRYRGKTDDEAFGGPLASMLEELKAQTGSLYFLEMLRERGVINDELARQSYLHSIVWSFGHISRGMYTGSGQRKPYSQLAAIQVGFLMDEGAIHFDTEATAANGEDRGAFVIDFERLPAAVEKLMKTVATIKAKTQRKRAEELAAKYVDGDRVPMELIRERYLRFPKASFLYSFEL